MVNPTNIEADNPSGANFNIFKFASFLLFVTFSNDPTTVNKIQKIKIIARRTSFVFVIKLILVPTFM